MNSLKYISDKVLINIILVVIIITGCNRNEQKLNTASLQIHWAEIRNKGIGMIYIDKVDCNTALEKADTIGNLTRFHCYKIGFIDSMPAQPIDKKQIEIEKYFQYEMYKDWIALVEGDSIQSVFYQSAIKKEKQKEEGVLVFEIDKNKQVDTLVYTDSYGSWGIQVIINNK